MANGPGSDLLWEPHPAPLDGAVGDANTMRISPDHLGMAQDVIIDTEGILRSRGSIQSYTSDTFNNMTISGAAQIPTNSTINAGTILTTRDASVSNFLYGTNSGALTGFAKLTVAGAAATAESIIDSATLSPSFARFPDDRGLMLAYGSTNIGSNGFTNWGMPLMWGGNSVTTNNTSTGTAASTIGSKAITGVGTSWTSALVGCYLFINNIYVGQVDIVGSGTSITLRKGAIATVAANTPKFKTARLPMYMVWKGRITTNTSSTTVVGSNTKFLNSSPGTSAGAFLTTGTAATLYRYSDGAYVGSISAIPNDTTLTLGANAAIALVNEEYYIVINAAGTALSVGTAPSAAFSATCVEFYADRFWYGAIAANDVATGKTQAPYYNSVSAAALSSSNTLAFSKKGDPECLDLDPVAGDTMKLPTGSSADTLRALCATKGGMVIFRLNDAFLLTGYSPETFRIIKLVDDGTMFNASISPYKDGVVWAGKKSVWYFDGTRVIDLLQNKVKRFYRRVSTGFTALTAGVGLAVAQDHVMVSTSIPNVTWPYKNTTKTLSTVTWVVNMTNGAVSFFTNLYLTNGMIHNDGTSLLTATNGTNSYLLNGDKIIRDSSTGTDNYDAITGMATFSSGAQIGPDWQWETTELTMGDATRLKFWKRFLMNYSSDVSMSGTFIGTNNTTWDFPNISTGAVSTDTFTVSANTGILHRLRFLVRSMQMSVRVYQTSTTSATSQRMKMFWWAVGGKRMRQGRVQS